MEINETEQESINPYSAKKSRIRNEVKSASAVYLDESERNDSFSNSDDSEDEWNDSHKKKCRRSKKTVPKQTLKLKLLEKTRKLRQLGKLNSVSIPQDGCKAKLENVVPTSSIDINEKEVQAVITATETQLESNFNETSVTTTVEDAKPLLDKVVKCDSTVDTENVKREFLASNVAVKNETEILKKEKNLSVREPIVIEYSINRSQVLDTNASSAAFWQLYPPPNGNSNLQHRSLPIETNPLSISSQTISMKNSISTNDVELDNIRTNCVPNEPVNISCAAVDSLDRRKKPASTAKFSSNMNFHISPRNQTPNDSASVTSTKRCRISKSKPSRVTFRQTPDVGSHRISSITRPNSVRIVKNFKINDSPSTGSKKMFQNLRHENTNKTEKNNNSMLSAARINPSTKTNPVFNKLNNISPNGTVIHTGTGSVTITPRKIVPEKPPTQRKVFKNEIEGTISGRNIEGTLRYVVNLANGTFIPLSDLQIKKLREQNKGTLPIKLKIPVPCDVADKIEPSFIIED